MRRTRLLSTTALLAALASGCGGGSDTSGTPAEGARKGPPPITVGLLLDDVHERWQRDRDLFTEVAQDMGATVLVEVAEGDQARQNDLAAKLIDAGIKSLVVVAHDTDNAAGLVEAAKGKGIKVISYDRLIRNADVDLYMGFNVERVGEMQAQHLLSAAPRGNYLLIGGSPTDGNAKALRAGQLKVLEPAVKSKAIRIVGDGWADNWSADEARKLTEAALAKTKNSLAAIVASNDVTAAGAIAALEQAGLAGKVLVSGQDAELDAARRIVAGTQTMTVYKSLRTLTRLAARSAVLMAKGEKVDTSSVVNNGKIDVPAMVFDPIAVDKDNLDGVLIADGFLKKEDVYKK